MRPRPSTAALPTIFLLLILAACSGVSDPAPIAPPLLARWEPLAPLPAAPGQERQIGVAGAFAGFHNGALIVANGANFPLGAPWEKRPDGTTPPKIYQNHIFVLERPLLPARYAWTSADLKLDGPAAYGVSISTTEGLLCIGGEEKTATEGQTLRKLSDQVTALRWLGSRRGLTKSDPSTYPPLPQPCAYMAGAALGRTIYLAGGDSGQGAERHFWALDLDQKQNPETFRWRQLEPWPGPARVLPILVAQSDGRHECLYLFSGRDVGPDRPTNLLRDAYKYDPETARWSVLPAPILPGDTTARCVMAAPALPIGPRHILIFGGADGVLFNKLTALEQEIENTQDPKQKQTLETYLRDILNNHPGFSRDILAYDTAANAWTKAGELPWGSRVTTTAVAWNDAITIPSGEISPGVRTPEVWTVRFDLLK